MRNWVHCNDSQWPLVVFEAPLQFGRVELARHGEDLRRCAERARGLAAANPFIVVFDLLKSAVPAAGLRQALAEQRLAQLSGLEGLLLGEAFVVGSNAHCGLVRALNELAPLEHSQIFMRSRGDAIRWARECLKARGVAMPAPELRKSFIRERNALHPRWQPVADLSVGAQIAKVR